MARYIDREYERGARARRGDESRGMLERAGDEVRSWFGDHDAERRRRRDEREDNTTRAYDRAYGRAYDRDAARGDSRDHDRGARTVGGHDHFGELRAWEVMNRDVVTVRPGDAVMLAARLMGETDCGALPVVDREGEFIGMITDRDITVRAAARGADPRRTRVDECMTDKTFSCHADDSVEACLRQMSRHQIRRLPIVDDQDRVIGIVSQADIARHAGEHADGDERRAFTEAVYEISEPTEKSFR
jgi:CBS domain-containing protein